MLARRANRYLGGEGILPLDDPARQRYNQANAALAQQGMRVLAIAAQDFPVHYRGHRVEVRLTADQMRIESRPGTAPPITVQVGDKPAQLASGGHAEVDLTHRS